MKREIYIQSSGEEIHLLHPIGTRVCATNCDWSTTDAPTTIKAVQQLQWTQSSPQSADAFTTRRLSSLTVFHSSLTLLQSSLTFLHSSLAISLSLLLLSFSLLLLSFTLLSLSYTLLLLSSFLLFLPIFLSVFSSILVSLSLNHFLLRLYLSIHCCSFYSFCNSPSSVCHYFITLYLHHFFSTLQLN